MDNKKNIVDISLIKKLRQITGSGISDCKNSLLKSNNDIKLAILNMRKSGKISAINKSNNITAEGVILIQIKDEYAAMIELNCQTDFVSKNESFKNFGKKILSYVLKKQNSKINIIQKKFEEQKNILITQFSENIKINRIVLLHGQQIGYYLHNNMRIGVIISTKNMNEKLIKKIAMHIAASKPEFIHPEEINNETILQEKKIYLDQALKIGKNSFISEKIAEGKIKKFKDEISLVNQFFILDTKKTIKQILQENNAEVTSFIRFEIGEIL